MTDDRQADELPDPWTVGPYHPLNPVGWVDRFFTAQAKRQLANEKTYVDNPRRLRRLFLWDVGTFIVILALVVAEAWATESSMVDVFAIPLVILLLGRTLLARLVRARAYRNGWLDGRRQMIGSMTEAMRREMTIEQWLESEMERDHQVMRYL